MTPTIALAVPWCPWVPERVQSMERLRGALGIEVPIGMGPAPGLWLASTHAENAGLKVYREFTERLPNDQWSEQVFEWLASTDADWCMQIQEDALIPERFLPIVQAIIEADPPGADIIGLHVCHPVAEQLAGEGYRFFTTSDALVGVCWLVKRETMKEFVEWRRTQLVDGWRTPVAPKGLPALTEDTMMGVFAMVTGRKILHTIPAIVDHDTSIASVGGNDDHVNRRPSVPWTSKAWDGDMSALENPSWWQERAIPHVGRFYAATPNLARRWVKGTTIENYAKYKADDGAPFLMGLKHKLLAKAYKEPTTKLFIGTPHRGMVQAEYMASVLQLQRLIGIDVRHEMTLDVRHEAQDIVRVRSRMIRIANQVGCTHLVFADGDNAFPPEAVLGMLRTGKDYVQCPYLRRDGRGYTIRATEKDRKAGFTSNEDIQPDNTIEIEGTGLGLTILSRACIERMLAQYGGKDLDYYDVVDGMPYLTTALFQLLIRDGALLSEDASFAQRWRDIGGKVWLYIGNGSPIAHYGTTCFQGDIEDLGFRRAA
jgi:hypothetical protein